MQAIHRRPLKTRSHQWVHVMTDWLLRLRVKPNHISIMSMGFAGLAVMCLFAKLYLLAALCIQLRLLCNLMDGMVAVEGGTQSRSGELFNELPDRISDVMIFIGLGYSLSIQFPWGPTLGWMAAMMSVLTAYIRSVGVTIGTKAYFNGPMAKPHRMFTLTCACVVATFTNLGADSMILLISLIVIVLGSLMTCVRRLRNIIREINHDS